MPLGLTKFEEKTLSQWRDSHVKVSRLDWHFYFLQIADLVSQRSIDPRTKHGCILVDDEYSIVSTGYNSFVRNIDDTILPNKDPYKYDFMIHAELNAVLNACRHGKSTIGATAYITGPPCNFCLQYMYQAGIVKIIHGNRISHCMEDDYEKTAKKILIDLMKIDIKEVKIYD